MRWLFVAKKKYLLNDYEIITTILCPSNGVFAESEGVLYRS